MDTISAGPSGRQPKLLNPAMESVTNLKKNIARSCFGSSSEDSDSKGSPKSSKQKVHKTRDPSPEQSGSDNEVQSSASGASSMVSYPLYAVIDT